jgi:hypothetical protein
MLSLNSRTYHATRFADEFDFPRGRASRCEDLPSTDRTAGFCYFRGNISAEVFQNLPFSTLADG